jgi:hypothetical protein
VPCKREFDLLECAIAKALQYHDPLMKRVREFIQ